MNESALDTSAEARRAMIDSQLRPNEVNDARLIDAFDAVARENFVPKALRSVAYVDEDIEIAPGRFLMEPRVFARLLLAADIQRNNSVLDVGCGLGYSAAVLAHLVDSVVALESDENLADEAEERLAKAAIHNVAVVKGGLNGGVPKEGPFDVIVVEGGVERLSDSLLDQLSDGGRLVCVRYDNGVGRAHLVTKTPAGLAHRNLFDAQVSELAEFSADKKFVF